MYERLLQMFTLEALDLHNITMPGQVCGKLRACLLVLCRGEPRKHSTALLLASGPIGCPFSRHGESASQQDSRDERPYIHVLCWASPSCFS